MTRARHCIAVTWTGLLLASAACGYEGTTIPLDGLRCEEGRCVEGFLCDATTDTCVTPETPTLGTTTIAATESSIIADGVSTTLITVTVRNAAEAPLPGTVVSLATTFGQLLSGVDDQGDGTYTQVLQAMDTVGTATVTFVLDEAGAAAPQTAAVAFVPGPPSGDIFLNVVPSAIVADGVATARVTSEPITDEYGNVVGAGVTVTVSADPGICIVIGAACTGTGEVTTDARGTLSVEVRAGTLSGEVMTTVSVASATGGTAVTLLPGAPASIARVSGDAQSAAAGSQLSDALQVVIMDAHDNPVPSVVVSWAATSSNGVVAAAQSVTGAAGVATMAATLGPVAGTDNNLFEARLDGLTGSPVPFTASALPGPASAFSVVGPTSANVAGTPITASVTATDAFGNLVPDYAGTVALSSTDPRAILPADYTYQGVTDLGTHDFSVTLETAGRQGVTAVDTNDASITGTASDVEVVAADVAGLQFVTPPRAVTAGNCASVATIGTVDPYGNGAPVLAATVVSLTADSGTLGFYSDATCASVITDVTIPAGGSTADLHITDTTAGTPTVTATAPGLTAGSQTHTVTAAVPVRLTLPNAALTVEAGACSAGLVIEIEDVFGNRAPVSTDTTLDLSGGIGTLTFHSDAACLVPITSVLVPAGADSATVYFRDTTVGAPSVSISSPAVSPAAQTETIVPAPPSALGLVTPARTVTAAGCSSVVTVEILDAFGNSSPPPVTVSVSLSADSSTLGFFADSACTVGAASTDVAAETTTADLYFSDTISGTPTLTVSTAGLTSASQLQTVDPGPPVQFRFSTAPQTVVVGMCSAVMSVGLTDAQGNPSPVSAPTTATLSSDSATLSLYDDATCTTLTGGSFVIPALASGVDLYFQDTTSGTPSITVSAIGFTPATQINTLSAAPPDKLVFTSAAQTVPAGGCSGAVTVDVWDTFDNPSPPGSDVLVTLATDSSTMTLYSDASCLTAVSTVTVLGGTVSATFHFLDTTAGTPLLDASAVGLTSAIQAQTVQPGVPDTFVFAGAAQTLAAGDCSALVTVAVHDANGNVAPVAAPVVLSITSTSSTLLTYSDIACTTPASSVTIPAAGTGASFYFRDTTSGSPSVTVSAAAFPPASQVQTITPDVRSQLDFTTVAQGVLQWACSGIVTIESQDQHGNASPVFIDRAVDLTSDSLTLAFYLDAACTTPITSLTLLAGTSDGDFYFKDTIAGSPTITATLNGTPITATQTEAIVRPASDANSTLFASPTTVPGDGVSTATLTVDLRDSSLDPVPGQAVVLATTYGTLSSVVDNFDGTYTATLTAGAAGTASVSYEVNSTAFSSTASVTFTNLDPVIDAGVDETGRFPWDTIVLTGSGSDGNPNDTLTWLWTVVSQPVGAAGRFGPTWPGSTTTSVPGVDFWPDLSGTYTLSLSATDPFGSVAVDTMVITVVPFSQIPFPVTFSVNKQRPRQLAVLPVTGDVGMVTEDGAAIYLSDGTWASIDCQPGGATVGRDILVGPDTTSSDRFYMAYDGTSVLTRIDSYSAAGGCLSSTAFDTGVALGAPTRITNLALSGSGDLWIATDQDLTMLPDGGATTTGDYEFTAHGGGQAWGALAFTHGDALWVTDAVDGYHISPMPFDPAGGHLDLDGAATNAISFLVRGAKIAATNIDEMWLSTSGAGWWQVSDVSLVTPVQHTSAGSGLPSDVVGQAVFEDFSGDLWAATDAGLARYKRDVDAVVGIASGTSGLCAGAIVGVSVDGFALASRGRVLWVSCSNGLYTIADPP